jgi:hypothetical protein
LEISESIKRGKKSLLLDFFMEGDYFDRVISQGREEEENEAFLKKYYIGLEAWKEAYTKGTFSTFENSFNCMQKLSNITMHVGCCVDELVQVREMRPAERYEIHERWSLGGGAYMPGEHIKGPQEIQRQMKNKPDPIKRSEFEETAYKINSSLTLILGLYEHLPELVSEKRDEKNKK